MKEGRKSREREREGGEMKEEEVNKKKEGREGVGGREKAYNTY